MGDWVRVVGPYRVLSTSRSFRLLFVAQLLSSFIDWLYLVALFALTYDVTHSATEVALLTFTRLLPYALLSPLAGALSDRYPRGVMMALAAAGRAFCALGLVTVNSRSTLPLAFGLVLASTSLSSLFKPALLSAIPQIVPERDLIDANSVLSQVDMMSLGAGPGIAAAILIAASARAAFVVAAFGLLLCAVAVIAARVPSRPSGRETEDAGSGTRLRTSSQRREPTPRQRDSGSTMSCRRNAPAGAQDMRVR